MAAIRAQRVRLDVDLRHKDERLGSGELGWTVPGDCSGLAAAADFAVVEFDTGARLAVRVSHLMVLPWPVPLPLAEGAA